MRHSYLGRGQDQLPSHQSVSSVANVHTCLEEPLIKTSTLFYLLAQKSSKNVRHLSMIFLKGKICDLQRAFYHDQASWNYWKSIQYNLLVLTLCQHERCERTHAPDSVVGMGRITQRIKLYQADIPMINLNLNFKAAFL